MIRQTKVNICSGTAEFTQTTVLPEVKQSSTSISTSAHAYLNSDKRQIRNWITPINPSSFALLT
jgi:hypothetical protein